MNEILQYLKKNGEQLDTEIAVATGTHQGRAIKGDVVDHELGHKRNGRRIRRCKKR